MGLKMVAGAEMGMPKKRPTHQVCKGDDGDGWTLEINGMQIPIFMPSSVKLPFRFINHRARGDAEVDGGGAVKGGRPCLPRETGGTLQWGGFNCGYNDRIWYFRVAVWATRKDWLSRNQFRNLAGMRVTLVARRPCLRGIGHHEHQLRR